MSPTIPTDALLAITGLSRAGLETLERRGQIPVAREKRPGAVTRWTLHETAAVALVAHLSGHRPDMDDVAARAAEILEHAPGIGRGEVERLFFVAGRSLGRVDYRLAQSEAELTSIMLKAFKVGWYDVTVFDLRCFLAMVQREFNQRAGSLEPAAQTSPNGTMYLNAAPAAADPPAELRVAARPAPGAKAPAR